MQVFDPNNPNEKKKIIAAAVLGIAAIVILGYLFLGGGSKKPPANQITAAPTPLPRTSRGPQPVEPPEEGPFREIVYHGPGPAAPEADRNVFSYYIPLPPPAQPLPSPTPTPTPPLTVFSVSPSNVYARTGDFSLQVMGEKFTSFVQISLDGRNLPTRFISAQQVATTVPAELIANPGPRQVVVRSNDGKLYSNSSTLNVTPPPVPNYNYIGIIGKPRGNDIAVLQDKNSKDLLNVQRGDVLGGRFRLNSISTKEVVFVDTNLKIKHTIQFSAENPQSRSPTRRVIDDEP